MEQAKVSIIIPVYNGEKYINECLNSVLNETYENIEIVIVNDGSTDNTSDILNEYQENRIKIINQQKRKDYLKKNNHNVHIIKFYNLKLFLNII